MTRSFSGPTGSMPSSRIASGQESLLWRAVGEQVQLCESAVMIVAGESDEPVPGAAGFAMRSSSSRIGGGIAHDYHQVAVVGLAVSGRQTLP